MAAENTIRIVIAADGSAAIAGIKGVSGSLGDFERRSAGIGSAVKSHWLGISAAVVSAYLAVQRSFVFVGKSIELANVQEEAEKRLTVALGHRSQALIDQAHAIQSKTTFEDDAVISAQAMLAMFVKDESQIKKATEATLDLAAAKGMDLKNAADLVAKTLGSSTNALSRYGIEVTGAVGSTERLESAVNNITRVFGGQAVVAADTYGGKVVMLKNAWGDMQEEVGSAITQNRFMIETTGILKLAVEDLTKWVRENKTALMEMARDAVLFAVEGFVLLIQVLEKAAAAWRHLKLSSTASAEAMLAAQGDMSAAAGEETARVIAENRKMEGSWSALLARVKKVAADIKAAQIGIAAPIVGPTGAPGIPGAEGKATVPDWMKALEKAAYEDAKAYDDALIGANEAWRKWDLDQVRQRIKEEGLAVERRQKLEEEIFVAQRTQDVRRRQQSVAAAEEAFGRASGLAGQLSSSFSELFAVDLGGDQYTAQYEAFASAQDAMIEKMQESLAIRESQLRSAGQSEIEILQETLTQRQAITESYAQNEIAYDAMVQQKKAAQLSAYAQIASTVAGGLVGIMSKHAKAQFAVAKAMEIAMVYIHGYRAAIGAAAAVASTPYIGPALAAAAYSKWMAITHLTAALVAATAIGTLATGGASAGSVPALTPTRAGTVEIVPAAQKQETKPAPIINVHVYGPYVGDEDRFAREISPALRKAWEDNA